LQILGLEAWLDLVDLVDLMASLDKLKITIALSAQIDYTIFQEVTKHVPILPLGG